MERRSWREAPRKRVGACGLRGLAAALLHLTFLYRFKGLGFVEGGASVTCRRLWPAGIGGSFAALDFLE